MSPSQALLFVRYLRYIYEIYGRNDIAFISAARGYLGGRGAEASDHLSHVVGLRCRAALGGVRPEEHSVPHHRFLSIAPSCWNESIYSIHALDNILYL